MRLDYDSEWEVAVIGRFAVHTHILSRRLHLADNTFAQASGLVRSSDVLVAFT